MTSNYHEITNVPKDSITTIGTFIAPVGKQSFLQRVVVGGSNFGDFTLELNGNKIMRKRSWAGGELFMSFEFDIYGKNGKKMSPLDIITIKVEHSRPFNGDFEATFQVLNIG